MLALFIEGVFSGGNGPPDAFFQTDLRLPQRCLREAAIVSDQPHGFVVSVRPFAPEQQAARLTHYVGGHFSHVSHACPTSRADIVASPAFRLFAEAAVIRALTASSR